MTRQDVLRAHLASLDEALGVLERHAADAAETFRGDIERLFAVERAFQVALQNMLDLGAHVLAEDFGRRYEEYRDIPLLLGEVGALPADLASALASLAGFRNVLVHAYLLVRLDLLAQHLRVDPPLLRRFASAVEAWAARE